MLAAALLLALAPSPDPAAPTFARPLQVPAAGKVVVTLDADVYERARADLGDLRVRDEADRQVPYLLEHAQGARADEVRRPRVLNRTFVRGQASSVTLDFASPVLKSELVVVTAGDNFRRRVTVEGRNRHDTTWETVTDSAYVFAVPAPAAARYETVTLPENNFQFLKVTVHQGPEDKEPVRIEDAWTCPQERRRPREEARVLPVRAIQDEKARETHLLVDLGARHQPFRALVLEVAEPQFFRGVTVESRSDPGNRPADMPPWRALEETSIYRYQEAGKLRHKLRLEVAGRERTLRLRIRNRDDRPLQVTGLVVMVPVERLVFEAEPGSTYRLTYGSERLDAPVYDVARTVRDPTLWIAQAAEGALGQPLRLAVPQPAVPWTERHPALVWGGLLALVGLLGAVTFWALRRPDAVAP